MNRRRVPTVVRGRIAYCDVPPAMPWIFQTGRLSIYMIDERMMMRKQLEGFTCILIVTYFIPFQKQFLDIPWLLLSTHVDKFFDSSPPLHSVIDSHNWME